MTAIVKASFSIVMGGIAALTRPAKIARDDCRYDGTLNGSITVAGDLAPYRSRVDVTFVGHAYAGPRATIGLARLAIFRERPILDKTIHVYGDRAPANHNAIDAYALQPFDRMPLVYERACASLNDPSGVENPVGARLPNLIDPRNPRRAAGFGPIARDWPGRARLLRGMDARSLDGPVAEIPDGFDWRYFQSAPLDQQIEALQGDEWIVMDGLHPTTPRVHTRLPRATAIAWVGRRATENVEALALVADTLAIDGDRQACDVVWRGSFPVPEGERGLPQLRIVTSLDLSGASRVAPSAIASAPRGASVSRRMRGTALGVPMPTAVGSTPEGLAIAIGATPFPLALPGATRGQMPEIRGAPWAAAATPAPRIEAPLHTTMFVVDSNELRPGVATECPTPSVQSMPQPSRKTVIGGQLPMPEASPFPLAAHVACTPSPDIVGAPWATSPAPVVPKITNALATTAPLLPPPAPLGSAPKPRGVLFGKPKAKKG